LAKAGGGQLIAVSNPGLVVCIGVHRGTKAVGIAGPTVEHKGLIYEDPSLMTAIDELPFVCKYSN
jgi:hypothetical protein